MNHTPAPSLPLVRLDHVWLSYGSSSVIKDLSLCIGQGCHRVLLGKNGSGKSSLLRLIQGELRPSLPRGHDSGPAQSPGRIYWAFDGREETSALAAREHVRLVSSEQQSNYVRRGWKITGEEIILSGLDNAPMLYGDVSPAGLQQARLLGEEAGALELFVLPAPAMSQGQLRLVLILRALMGSPALLLLDEPFDGLDQQARHAMARCLELAAAKGCTLLVTAHRRRDIPGFISNAILLKEGCLQAVDIRSVKSAGVIEARDSLETGCKLTGIRHSTPAPLAESRFLAALDAKVPPLLSLRDVDVYIDRKKILRCINWQVQHGEHWVISGPNGSGKSTLMRLVYGEEFAAWGGKLEWCGGLHPAQDELRAGVGFVSDRLQHRYDYDISAEEVVISGLRGTIGLYDAVHDEERELARCWLGMLDVDSFADKPFHSLSGGTARKVLLARALAGSPSVLLLDEPCTGLDAESRALFLKALQVLAEQGVTLIYASHHDEDKAAFFRHELKLEKGRIVETP